MTTEEARRCSRLASGYVKPCLAEEAPCEACYEAQPERWPDMADWFAEHRTSTFRPAAPSEEPVKHWCLKTNGDTCPMPCANGCDDERSDA